MMDSQIAYMRRASTVFKILAWLALVIGIINIFLTLTTSLLVGVTLNLPSLTNVPLSSSSQLFVMVMNIVAIIGSTIITFFILWTASVVLAFLADLGDGQEDIWRAIRIRRSNALRPRQ